MLLFRLSLMRISIIGRSSAVIADAMTVKEGLTEGVTDGVSGVAVLSCDVMQTAQTIMYLMATNGIFVHRVMLQPRRRIIMVV
jgi:hypothetical protein